MSGHTYIHTHTYTHDNYSNPRCAHAHRGLIITRNRSLSNIGRASETHYSLCCHMSKYINYTIGINDNNCVFVCNLILGW